MNELVTVAVFTYAHEMAVVRARLEWEGITCYTQDEHTVSAHPFYSNLIGGIKLRVRAGDVARARRILLEAGVIDMEQNAPDPLQRKNVPALPIGRVLVFVAIGLLLVWVLFA